MLSEACEALIPLYRIWDAVAAFACSMLSPPLFPARTVISFVPAPFLWGRAVALEALPGRPEQKTRRRLYINLSMGWLHVHSASEQESGKCTECGRHAGCFRVLIRTC